MKGCRHIVLVLLALAPFFGARASNIQIANVSLKDRDTMAGTVYIKFDLSWEFSWKDRTHGNWDAAWVFVKAYEDELKTWSHVNLVAPEGRPRMSGSGCYIAAPHEIGSANEPMWTEFGTSNTDFGEKVTGLFIYRKDVGNGHNTIENIRLKWKYADDGFLSSDNLQVAVFAIEMVYVPEHTYILGDGISPNALFADGKNLIIKTDVVGGSFVVKATMGTIESETGFTYQGKAIPDAFPMGHKAFYMMKYEISQHAYADFLNTLTAEQQEKRAAASPYAAQGTLAMIPAKYNSNPTQYRNFIRIRAAGLRATGEKASVAARYGNNVSGGNGLDAWDLEMNGGNIACNFLSWNDGAAYLDWACLRPFSELEYEKACRGTRFLKEEMAWGEKYGTAVTAKGATWFTNPNQPDEKSVNLEANYIPTGKAPWVMRVGGFSGDSTTRSEAGATYYGILNMSDNLWERCINVSTDDGRKFIPNEGDGKLDELGEAEVFPDAFSVEPCWPDASGKGTGFRGGKVSDRTYAESKVVINNEGDRTPYTGFRGARYAPPETRYDLSEF